MQVGRMGCVPACGCNSYSRNVSCSQPSLHCQGAPSGRRYINRLKSAFTSHSDTKGTQKIGWIQIHTHQSRSCCEVGCEFLAPVEYLQRHNKVEATYTGESLNLSVTEKYYMHEPEKVTKMEDNVIMWDKTVLTQTRRFLQTGLTY